MAGKLGGDLYTDALRPGDHVGDPQVIAQAHANAVAGGIMICVALIMCTTANGICLLTHHCPELGRTYLCLPCIVSTLLAQLCQAQSQ